MFEKSTLNETWVEAIAESFNAAPIDGIVTYQALNEICPFDTRQKRYLIEAARRKANRDYGVVTRSVRGVGYQRISDGASVGLHRLDAARRQVRNGSREVGNWMRVANLTDDQAKRGYGIMTQLGIIEAMARRRAAPETVLTEGTVDVTAQVRATVDALMAIRSKKTGG